jgi:hypothetical protein
MSKSKKAKKATDQENPVQVESHEVNGEEHAPPTIVEAAMEEVFPSQESVTEQTEEKPAPKPKVSKRPYIADVEILLNAGTHTKPQILAFIMEKYPQISKGGASTFLTDLLNEKYRHWKERAVTKTPEGKLVFADRLEAPVNDGQPAVESGEQPAE